MRDDRVTVRLTADYLAKAHRLRPLFWLKSREAIAVYIFGIRVYSSKAWNEPSYWQRRKIRKRNY